MKFEVMVSREGGYQNFLQVAGQSFWGKASVAHDDGELWSVRRLRLEFWCEKKDDEGSQDEGSHREFQGDQLSCEVAVSRLTATKVRITVKINPTGIMTRPASPNEMGSGELMP